MESYRTEEEQVEALKRWWEENGRSTVAAVVIVLAAAFGWQGWQGWQASKSEAASDIYQALIKARTSSEPMEKQRQQSLPLAEQLKAQYANTTYAQFAALHLAAMAVEADNLEEAEAQLRWVLGRADNNSDTARVAQLRLARVMAARGEVEPALAILAEAPADVYEASYALARGDVLLAAGREDEARQAYMTAQTLASLSGQQMAILQAKLQRLTPVPAAVPADTMGAVANAPAAPAAEPAGGDAVPAEAKQDVTADQTVFTDEDQ
ncbi:MAG: tetratricopeptide repeat protein [Halioglobus sp.]